MVRVRMLCSAKYVVPTDSRVPADNKMANLFARTVVMATAHAQRFDREPRLIHCETCPTLLLIIWADRQTLQTVGKLRLLLTSAKHSVIMSRYYFIHTYTVTEVTVLENITRIILIY